jgi:uncharacterized protein YbjT (DUF2867 family)
MSKTIARTTIRLRRAVVGILACATVLAACASAPRAANPAGGPSQRILVLGGTGLLGAEIVAGLVARGHAVTVFVRPTSDRSRLAAMPVRYHVGELFADADVAGALRAARYDTVIVALRVMDGDVRFYEKALTPLARHARANGVRQIIHHGAVGAGANAANFPNLGWERVPGLLDRLRDQGVGEQLLRDSGVPYTIIRNSRIYPEGTAATGQAELTEDTTVLTPMTRADLARLTLQCVGAQRCFDKVFHVRDPSLAWPPPRPAH